jgi:hypothetical protein
MKTKMILMVLVVIVMGSGCASLKFAKTDSDASPYAVKAKVEQSFRALGALKTKLNADSTDTSVNLLIKRGSVLFLTDSIIKSTPLHYRQWNAKDKKYWDDALASKMVSRKEKVWEATLDNHQKMMNHPSLNVETGSGHNLTLNPNFKAVISSSFKKESMRDFLAFNQKNDWFLMLKADTGKQVEAQKVFGENVTHLNGEIIGQKKLAAFVVQPFADETLWGPEGRTFISCERVLKDPKASLKTVVDTLGAAVELLQSHLLYAGGIDMFSGKKVIIPLRENDFSLQRNEFATFMQVKGQETTQQVTFYGVLPKNFQGALTSNQVPLRMIENPFTAESKEDLVDNNFNKTQLMLPEYFELKKLFEQKVKDFTSELNDAEQKALETVRLFHDVYIVLRCYQKAEEGLNRYVKKEEKVITDSNTEAKTSKKSSKKRKEVVDVTDAKI